MANVDADRITELKALIAVLESRAPIDDREAKAFGDQAAHLADEIKRLGGTP
jgi:hypothetical protein